MGFFKDFKQDLSQAVNELSDDAVKMTTGENSNAMPDDDVMVDTLGEDLEAVLSDSTPVEPDTDTAATADTAADEVETESVDEEPAEEIVETVKEETEEETQNLESEASDETTIITAGLKIKGDIDSNGSIELLGDVTGNVVCSGKLVVCGRITGDTKSSEFFSDKADIKGNVSCDGPAKIGNGSKIIGNLVAASAVIAGAIQGDIDVQGPVILDSTAIVLGNIKSKTLQINNGAAMEGYNSQCYADNSPKKFFGVK